MRNIRYYIEDSIYRGVKDSLNYQTFKHSIGVAKMGIELSARFNINASRTVNACFLHDIAKDKSIKELNALYKKYRIKKDKRFPELTVDYHAKAGAEIAKDIYGIKDKEILNAIRNHTIGKKGMGRVEKALYVADFIESGREHKACRKMRRVFRNKKLTLDKLVAGVIIEKLRYLGDNGYTIHTDIFDLLNEVK